jgi:hypothetical protein
MILTVDKRYTLGPRDLGRPYSKCIYNDDPVEITNKSDISLVSAEYIEKYSKSDQFTKFLKPVYSISKKSDETIQLAEMQRDQAIKKVVDYLLMKNDCQSMKVKAIQNILDLNIVPINVHAMMREIPLVNLYNYSYTFDRMMVQIYKGDVSKENFDILCKERGMKYVNSAQDAIISLLVDPYRSVSSCMKEVVDMLLGLANIGELGRPKLLSDQIYGKLIFGDLFRYDTYDNNNSGPGYHRGKHLTPIIMGYIRDILVSILGGCVSRSTKYNQNVLTKIIALYTTSKAVIDKNEQVINKLCENPFLSYTEVFQNVQNEYDNVKEILAIWFKIMIPIILYCFTISSTDTPMNLFSKIIKKSLSLDTGITKTGFSKQTIDDHLFKTATIDPDNYGYKIALNLQKSFDDCNIKIYQNFIDETATTFDINMATVSTQLTALMDRTSQKDYTNYSNSSINNDILFKEVLHFKNEMNNKFESVKITDNKLASDLRDIGVRRLDTVIIRNIIFIVNLYRTVRLKLQRDLNYNKDIILKSAAITRPEITEFYGNQMWHDQRSKYEEDEDTSNKNPRYGLYRRQRY